MEFKDTLYTKEDGIATITLNRPQALNALTSRMHHEWIRAIEDAARDDEVRVLVDQNNLELRLENDRLRDRIAKLKGVLLAASYEGPKASHHKVLMIGRYVIDFDTADGDPVRAVLDEDQADDVHHKGPAQ
ncbi:hypothetical protein LCGC14_2925030 [marine sediment metagenome]|uniref:Enoyl-CoA hydratase/isomerase family protein n=1 Tax=marine sediment metagenome TaxID=412755 RepID=A0A0F8XMX4_9ZZZZ